MLSIRASKINLKYIFYSLSVLLSIYVLVITRWGYEFGRNDSMQLSYSLFLNDQSLFSNDFYIQGLHKIIPNERIFFSIIFGLFQNLSLVSKWGHLIISLLLFGVVNKISALFITKNEVLRWFVQAFLFIFLYGINLGGCEIYYNNFFVSLIAKTIGLWGFYYFLKNRLIIAFLFFSLSTFFQPIAGFHLFIIVSVVLVNLIIERKLFDIRESIYAVMLYLLTAGIWLILLKINFEGTNLSDTKELFEIFFVFRNSHHYIPSTFPLKSYLILLPLYALGAVIYFKKDFRIFLFYIIVFVGLVFYTFFVELFHSVEISSIQFFKATIWLKLFSLIAVFSLLERYFEFLTTQRWKIFSRAMLYILSVTFLLIVIIKKDWIPWHVNFDFGNQIKTDKHIRISVMARELTSKNALFVQPIWFTELKYYSQRSSFVDFKTPVHRKTDILEWYKRINLLYGLDFNRVEPTDITKLANNNFVSHNELFFKKLEQEYGITHILTFKEHVLSFPELCCEGKFKIYKID